MKQFLVLLISVCFTNILFSQTDYDKQMEFFASDVSKKLPAEKKKIAVIDFKNNDDEITQLTRLVSEDISSELAIISSGQSKFQVVERNNLKAILNDLKLSSGSDDAKIAKELGRKAIADVLITGTVTLFGDNYRISIKVLDTENGNIITASKGLVVKTTALEELHKKPLEKIKAKTVSTEAESKGEAVPCSQEKGNYIFLNNTSDFTLEVYIDNKTKPELTISPMEKGELLDGEGGVHKVRYEFIAVGAWTTTGMNKTKYGQIKIDPCKKMVKPQSISP